MCWPPLANERAAQHARPTAHEIGTVEARRGGASILAALGDRHLAFSEQHQAIYELDDLAAYVWRSLDAGMSVDQIVREIIESGVGSAEAKSAVRGAAESLRALGHAPVAPLPSPLPEPTPLPGQTPFPQPTGQLARLIIRIAGVAVQLHLSKALAGDVEAVFGPLIADMQEYDVQLCARVAGNNVNFCSPGQPDWSCERSQFVPLLKAQLIESVLLCARYEVALHAAALVRDDDAVLLVGSPGAGKTTLAIAMAKAGFEVIADDVVLLDDRGLVTGISLPFAAKASSWPLISRHWPGIAARPSHWRPDGQELCYIFQEPVADPRPRRMGRVILLNRQDLVPTSIDEVNPVGALSALVAEGATRDQRLRPSGFTALVEGLREARCCRLTYSDLIEAATAVCSLRS